jgi:hypothetical protein
MGNFNFLIPYLYFLFIIFTRWALPNADRCRPFGTFWMLCELILIVRVI